MTRKVTRRRSLEGAGARTRYPRLPMAAPPRARARGRAPDHAHGRPRGPPRGGPRSGRAAAAGTERTRPRTVRAATASRGARRPGERPAPRRSAPLILVRRPFTAPSRRGRATSRRPVLRPRHRLRGCRRPRGVGERRVAGRRDWSRSSVDREDAPCASTSGRARRSPCGRRSPAAGHAVTPRPGKAGRPRLGGGRGAPAVTRWGFVERQGDGLSSPRTSAAWPAGGEAARSTHRPSPPPALRLPARTSVAAEASPRSRRGSRRGPPARRTRRRRRSSPKDSSPFESNRHQPCLPFNKQNLPQSPGRRDLGVSLACAS